MSETFYTLRLASVRHIPGDAVEVVFDVPPELAGIFSFKPGQNIMVRRITEHGPVLRNYSLCSGRNGPLRIGIKHLPHGQLSSWANTQLKAGDTLDVAAPRGRFVLPQPDAQPRHLLMLAAGAGITPILGMTIEALESEATSMVTLVYGTRTATDAMFISELEDLKDRFPSRFDLLRVLSRSGEAETGLFQGRLTGEHLRRLAQQRIDIKSVERAFVCGPGDFIKSNRNALLELGLAQNRIHHEFFAGRTGAQQPPAPRPPEHQPKPPVDHASATIVLDGQRHTIALSLGQTILDAALAHGLKAPHSCTAGMCSTCRAQVIEGKADMLQNYSLEEWEIANGYVLTCQAVPASDTIVIDYDAM